MVGNSKEILDRVKLFSEYLFMQRVFDDLEGEDRSGIHTSDVLDCLRKAYFDITDRKAGIPRNLTQRDAITFWLGKVIHLLPISNVAITDYGEFVEIDDLNKYLWKQEKMEISNGIERTVFMLYEKDTNERVGVWGHELPVTFCPLHEEDEEADKWECINGRADEIIYVPDVGLVLIDKKSATDIPKKPSDRYVRQTEYYSVMIQENWGLDIKYGEILYIKKTYDEDWKHYIEALPYMFPPKKKIREELVERLSTLVRALHTDVPPDPEPNYFCGKCPYYYRCVRTGISSRKKDDEITKLDEYLFKDMSY